MGQEEIPIFSTTMVDSTLHKGNCRPWSPTPNGSQQKDTVIANTLSPTVEFSISLMEQAGILMLCMIFN